MGSVRLEVVENPIPESNQVLLEIKAAPVNYVDLITLAGSYQFKPQLPYIPGKGPAGVVKAAGRDADFSPGDRVLGMAEYGGYAELVCVHQASCYRIPPSVSYVDAASMSLAFDTAWMALRDRARLSEGESVLVLGATGAVGNAAVQLAQALGAGSILAGTRSPEQLLWPAEPGAVIDLRRPNLRDSLRDQVMEATNGRGVDVIVDPIGGDAFDGAVRSLAWRGRLVVVGFASGRIPSLKMNYPLLKNIEISGLQISDYRKRAPEIVAESFRQIFGMVEERRIFAPRSTTLPLHEFRRALEIIEKRTSEDRIVLLPDA